MGVDTWGCDAGFGASLGLRTGRHLSLYLFVVFRKPTMGANIGVAIDVGDWSEFGIRSGCHLLWVSSDIWGRRWLLYLCCLFPVGEIGRQYLGLRCLRGFVQCAIIHWHCCFA